MAVRRDPGGRARCRHRPQGTMSEPIELELHPGEAPVASRVEADTADVVVWRVPPKALAALRDRYRQEIAGLRKRVADARIEFIEAQRTGAGVTESLTLLREVEADLDWCQRAIAALEALDLDHLVYRG